ncbi:17164_t:CDS:2 [Funneliformis caledonium]|uniref:17164_t:CDS:1 n=1 Tax=Funneliformis caledonium TaxID=1117310 RepID=A0A9N9CA72_9GLOM|nr:17164_t:CDS:2 [Funneliformis caledonium]
MSGVKLMKRNVIREANRLHIFHRLIISQATILLWRGLTVSQRNQFTTFANLVNHINPTYTARRRTLLFWIHLITQRQVTNNEYADMLYNGLMRDL